MKSIFRGLIILAISVANSVHADRDRTSIKACEGNAGPFKAFPGEYIIRLKIGDRIFYDELRIDQITRGDGMASYSAFFNGHFSVPGIFDSEIKKSMVVGVFPGEPGFETPKVNFEIEANEGGKKFPVYFSLKESHTLQPEIYSACHFTGKAYLAEDSVLGEAVMFKTLGPCTCPLN